MRLSAPTMPVFLVSLVIAVLALLTQVGISIPFVSDYPTWTAIVAYAVLMVGTVMKGL